MDKDGILACLVLVKILSQKGSHGALLSHLRSIFRELGLFGSYGRSRRFPGSGATSPVHQMKLHMSELRTRGPELPPGWVLDGFEDFSQGAEQRPPCLGEQDLLRYRLVQPAASSFEPRRAELLIRPSGTEPKLKAYVHLQSDYDEEMSLRGQVERLGSHVDTLVGGFLQSRLS